mgnify:CR=1 FL=1
MKVGDLVRYADHSQAGRVNVSIVTAVKAPGGTPWLAQIHRADASKSDLWWPVEKLEVIDASR